jgi:hypothetical protein
MMPGFDEFAEELAVVGRRFYARLGLGTSEFQRRQTPAVEARDYADTAHKGKLGRTDPADRRQGPGIEDTGRRRRRNCTGTSSYRGAGAVLHTHSIWSTILALHAGDRARHRSYDAQGPRRPRRTPIASGADRRERSDMVRLVRGACGAGEAPGAHAFIARHGLHLG